MSSRSRTAENAPRKRKRPENLTRIACTLCRRSKVACDGVRPTCGRCQLRQITCEYDTDFANESRSTALRRQNESLRAEVASLRGTVDRSSHSTPVSTRRSLVFTASGSPISPSSPLSYHKTNRSIWSTTLSALEFELMATHSLAYVPIPPVKNPQLFAELLLGPKSDRLQQNRAHQNLLTQIASEADTFLDPRLADLDISYWTTVQISNRQAASMIGLYLSNDHPITGLFDADLFIGDLVDRKLNYCSPLLVIALLYYESHAYSAFDPDIYSKSPLLHTAAKALLEVEETYDSCLNVVALQLLSQAEAISGSGHSSETYLLKAQEMASRLWSEIEDTSQDDWFSDDGTVNKNTRFAAHIIWGYFASSSAWCFYYGRPIERAIPHLPMPGTAGFPAASYLGSTFSDICRFWTIAREISILYNPTGKSGRIDQHVPLAAVELRYQKLLAWSDQLQRRDQQSELQPFHTQTLQIWYHCAIAFLMRPWLNKGLRLQTFTNGSNGPDAVNHASLRQLRRLMLVVRSSYAQALYAVHWHASLMYVANAAMTETQDPEAHFFMMVALVGYADLWPAFDLAGTCLRGLLGMAVEQKRLSLSTACRFEEQALRIKTARGSYEKTHNDECAMPLNLDKTSDGAKMTTAKDLAQRFYDLKLQQASGDDVVFSEFTTLAD